MQRARWREADYDGEAYAAMLVEVRRDWYEEFDSGRIPMPPNYQHSEACRRLDELRRYANDDAPSVENVTT